MVIAFLAWLASGLQAGVALPKLEEPWRSESPADVAVCAKRGQQYRIDKSVLEASRAAEARPPKPPIVADNDSTKGCVGPMACQGDMIPLVGMAMVAAKAAALAASGEDWREAIRTHEDEYRLCKQAEARRARDRKPRIGIAFSNQNAPTR